jgi:hypothetical protein
LGEQEELGRMKNKWQSLSARSRFGVFAAGAVALATVAGFVAIDVRARFVKAMRMNELHTTLVAERLQVELRQVQSRLVAEQAQADARQAQSIQLSERLQTELRQLRENSDNTRELMEQIKVGRGQQALPGAAPASGSALPVANVPATASSLPADVVPASLRTLPYPFAKYFSIASDADSMPFDKAGNIYNTLNKLNLPLADSIFMEAGPHNAQGAKANGAVPTVDLLTGDSQLDNLAARWFQNGLVDTHHGLYSGFHLGPAGDGRIELRPKSPAEPKAVGQIPFKRYFAFSQASFFPEAPPSLVIEYTMPLESAVLFKLVGEGGEVIWTSPQTRLPPRIVPTAMGIPLAGLDLAKFNKAARLSLEIEYSSSFEGSFLKIDSVGISDRSRGRAKLGFDKARELNIQIPVFSRHGMPPGGNVGVSHLHALPDTIAWAHVFQGDNPKSPLYWADLLDEHGVEFLGRDTAVDERLFDIGELTYPYMFNDGRLRYSFHRLFSSRNATAKSSWEEGIPEQFKRLFPLLSAAPNGAGGLLYTHWGIPMAKEQFDAIGGEWPLSKPTIDGMTEMAGRYYGVLNGARLPLADRWWIAPVYKHLVYSTVRRQVADHAFVSANGNDVHIRPFTDPVTNRRIPGQDLAGKRLQAITIYVKDSAKARAFVDGVEFHSFTRNPADETGRQSITFVDNSTPTVIFDEIDLQQRPGTVTQRNARVFPVADGAYAGNRAMEIVTQGANGFVEWRPEALTCSRSDAFQFAMRKSAPGVRARIVVTDANDKSWEFAEGDGEATTAGATLARFAATGSDAWSVQTFSFARLEHAANATTFAPWGEIKSVRFGVSGEQGDSIKFDRVACLRENPLDQPSQGFRISGQISFDGVPAAPTKVEMTWAGKAFETVSDEHGIYAFAQFVPRDALIEVNAISGPIKDRYAPKQGRLIQVTNNIADLDIKVSKEQRAEDLNGSVPAGTTATGQYIKGAGNHYRPGSRFTTTGLSNPTEFKADVFLNNLGYIDREHRPGKMSPKAKRIVLLGACNLWGHTESIYHNTATVMESMLRARSSTPIEVMNMSTATQHAGVSWFFYDQLGRDYKPDVVYYELVGPLDVGLSNPQYASIYNMTLPTNLPSSTFVPDASGGLTEQRGDPEYFKFPITDKAIVERRNAELKKNAYIIDGIDFTYLFHRDPVAAPFNEREQEVVKYYQQLISGVKARFDKEGVKVVFLVTDHFGQAYVPPTIDNQPYHRRHFDARMKQLCTEAKAECMHFVPWMEGRFSDLTQRHWRRDSHYSRVGYRWFAEALVEHHCQSGGC